MTQQSPVVEGFDRTANGVGLLDHLVGLAKRTLEDESAAPGKLDLIFVDRDEMAELNETHMGHAGPTDVLAFPLDADETEMEFGELRDELGEYGPLVHLGDVVVCPDVAEGQAPQHCGQYDAELSLLVIHGVLHVLGHDHAEPKETDLMQERERFHMAEAGFGHPRWDGPERPSTGQINTDQTGATS